MKKGGKSRNENLPSPYYYGPYAQRPVPWSGTREIPEAPLKDNPNKLDTSFSEGEEDQGPDYEDTGDAGGPQLLDQAGIGQLLGDALRGQSIRAGIHCENGSQC